MPVAAFAVSRRVSVAMIAAAIVVLGIFAIPRLPVDLLPSFQPPVVSVSVNYGNTSPETMESTVTRPIENAVARVAGIDYLQSNSFQGVSVVRAQFTYGTDIDVATNDIEQQVARAQSQLPTDPNLQQPQIVKADPNAAPVVRYYVTDPTRTQRDLNDLFTNVLADRFSAVAGVGSAAVSGGPTRAIMVEPDQRAIAGYGISNADIIRRIANENVDDPAGIIAIGPSEFGIRTSALYRSASEVGDAVVAMHGGTPVMLRDVATVSDSIEEQRVFTRVDGVPAISLVITAQPDANVVRTADAVAAKVDEIRKAYPTLHFVVAFEQRGFIQAAIDALTHSALLGAALAVLVILLFLHSWRSTLIVAVALPVSVLGTFFATYLFHQTLNTMTLGGLALAIGLIVDDAVVVVENIFRHLDDGEAPLEAARDATTQIFSAVVSSTVTVVTVFVPLLLIPGLQGLIFGPFALTVMTGVAISLLVAVTTVPMLSSIVLRAEDAHARDRFARAFDRGYGRLERGYRRLLAGALDRPLVVVASSAILLGASIAALAAGAVKTEVFPAADSRYVRLNLRAPNGTSLARTNAIARFVERELARDPRVVAVGATIGSGGMGTQRPQTNNAQLAVTLAPAIAGARATAFVKEWQRRHLSDGHPEFVGVVVRASTIDILQQQLSQGNDALQVQILGPDVLKLYDLAQAVIPQISKIPGVERPDTNIQATQPEVDVRIDRRAAAQVGFGTGDVAADVATATSGTVASYYQTNGIEYPIVVEAPAAQRRSFESLGSLPLVPPPVPGASTEPFLASVPLGSIARITTGFGPSQIPRQDKQRRIDIDAGIGDAPLGDVTAATQRVMNRFPLPTGYRWQFGPENAQNDSTFGALGLVVVLAIALVYMLLASQFESFLDPLVIMVSVPLALVGIVGSLVLTGRAFGLTAFIGSLMLVGIAVKNAILVVEFTKQLRRGGMGAREALLHACPRRLRPILMTTVATIGGMLPLAAGLEAGSTTQAPLGTVVIGGLVTSTLLSLVVVPTLYLWVATHVGPRTSPKPPSPRGRDLSVPPVPVAPPAVASAGAASPHG